MKDYKTWKKNYILNYLIVNSQDLLRSLNITDDDMQKMIADAVFFLVVADQKKSIITKGALVKACEMGKRDRKLQDYVIKRAAQQLSDAFGIELRDLPKTSTYILGANNYMIPLYYKDDI